MINLRDRATLQLGLLTLAAMSMSACTSSSPPQIVEVGSWVSRLGKIREFSPCKDGNYAWGISPVDGTVGIWFRSGSPLNSKRLSDLGEADHIWPVSSLTEYRAWVELVNGKILLITIEPDAQKHEPQPDNISVRQLNWTGRLAREIVSSPDGRFGWIIPAIGEGLYLVDTNKQLLEASQVVVGDKSVDKVYATAGNSAWVSFAPNPGLYFVDATGAVNVGKALAPDSIVGSVYPLEDGSHAWLDVKDRFHLASSDSELLGRSNKQDKGLYNPNLYLADKTGTIIQVSQSLFHNEPIKYCSMSLDEPQQLWIIANNESGVFLIRAGEQGLRIVKRFMPDVSFEAICSATDGTKALAVAADHRSLFRFDKNEDGQRLLTFPLEEGPILLVSLSLDSNRAWVAFSRPRGPYQLSIIGLDKDRPLDRTNIFLRQRIVQVYPLPGDTHACIVTNAWSPGSVLTPDQQNDTYVINNAGQLNQPRPFLTDAGTILLWYDSESVWLGTCQTRAEITAKEYEVYALGTRGYVDAASVTFDSTASLKYERANAVTTGTFKLTLNENLERAEFEILFHNGQPSRDPDCTARLLLTDDENKQTAYESAKVKAGEKGTIQLNWKPQWDRAYGLALQLEDSAKTQYSIQWNNVYFVKPFTQRRWFRSVCAAIFVYCGVFCLLFLPGQTVRRWVPGAVLLLGNTALTWWHAFAGIDTSVLWLLFPVGLIILLGLSLARPSIFFRAAQAEPFEHAVPYLLNIRFVRKRVFTPYAKRLRRHIEDARRAANDEIYIEIPAAIRSARGDATIEMPSKLLLDSLTSQRKHTNVMVESPGGHGKTALVRQVALHAIGRFEKDSRSPLPVFCEPKADSSQPKGNSIETMVSSALGMYTITDKILADQLANGSFFAVIDGPNETSLNADTLSEFIRSAAGAMTPLLIATRPNKAYQTAMRSSEQVLIIEPLRLSDETLTLFEEIYYRNDMQLGFKSASHLTENVKGICRGPDGTYLPILVRLAMRLGTTGIASVRELYAETLNRLLTNTPTPNTKDLIDQTVLLCKNTYWRDGQHVLRYSDLPTERGELIEKLVGAGIMFAEGPPLGLGKPRGVRFFHDSMQSYLTARALVDDASSWESHLERAAADPIFRGGPAEDSTEAIPEIFQMCLEVFYPVDRLVTTLQSGLLKWAQERSPDIRQRDITSGLRSDLRDRLINEIGSNHGAGDILRRAVEICMEADGRQAFQHLGQLYARIAAAVWRD